MDYIKFSSTYKADGAQYEKIVFWNRFLRNKTELIITLLPAIISIAAFACGYRSTFLMIVYCIFLVYPFIVYRQFKSTVKYHLTHRDSSESAPCEFTLMDSGILCEFTGSEDKKIFKWEDFTTVYDKLGYYMFFQKGDMLVMLNQTDFPSGSSDAVRDYINQHIDHNKCIMK
ncbi:MAG: hypothetical protein PUF12_12490 [Thermoflexaceae bacterium]|nr:hypothetical protein [Thermoflexaceae bacterium]